MARANTRKKPRRTLTTVKRRKPWDYVRTTRLVPSEEKRTGRPSAFSWELVGRICEHIAAQGVFIETACALEGISSATFRRWVLDAVNHPEDSPCRGLPEMLQAAKEAFQASKIALINKVAKKNWKAAAWMLMHGPDKWRYAAVQQAQVSGTGGGPIAVSLLDTARIAIAAIPEGSLEDEIARLDGVIDLLPEADGHFALPAPA